MRENPWRTLKEQHPKLEVSFDALPAGTEAEWHGDQVVLAARLNRTQRRCALMHELVHVERQVGWPDATAATMQREEAIVRRETAGRLVPAGELAAFVAERGTVEPICAQMVAEEFDVTVDIATEAMWALVRRQGASLG